MHRALWTGNGNERGDRQLRLLHFAEENILVVTNSFFQKTVNRHREWEALVRKTKNQTDFILSSNQKIVGNCEVINKVDIGSDHRMVRARVAINKKLMRLTKSKNKHHSN